MWRTFKGLLLAAILIIAVGCQGSSSEEPQDEFTITAEQAEAKALQFTASASSLLAQGFLDQTGVKTLLLQTSVKGLLGSAHFACPSSPQTEPCGEGSFTLSSDACNVEASDNFHLLVSDVSGQLSSCTSKHLSFQGSLNWAVELQLASACLLNSLHDSCLESSMLMRDLEGQVEITDENGIGWSLRVLSGSFRVEWTNEAPRSLSIVRGQVVDAVVDLSANDGSRFRCLLEYDLAECVPDADGDGIADAADNCPQDTNGDQQDIDEDGVGDACDKANIPCLVAPPCMDTADCRAFLEACPNVSARLAERGEDLFCPLNQENALCKVVLADIVGPQCSNGEAPPAPHQFCFESCDGDGDCSGSAICLEGCCREADYALELLKDFDADGVRTLDDNCPGNPDALDRFDQSNPTQGDCDRDGLGDTCDNCPEVFNPDQRNSESAEFFPGDKFGDVCDPDDDNDGIPDEQDPCPRAFFGSPVDNDGDGTPDICDNCLNLANPGQPNRDGDNEGDACDPCPDIAFEFRLIRIIDGVETVYVECVPDWDGDGVLNDGNGDGRVMFSPCPDLVTADCDDNCVFDPNSDQADSDQDGVGDVCDVVGPPPPPPPPPPGCSVTEKVEVSCADQADNDCDGATDGADSDCLPQPPPPPPPICIPTPGQEKVETSCGDGIDNDCDNATDGADADCLVPPPPPPPI